MTEAAHDPLLPEGNRTAVHSDGELAAVLRELSAARRECIVVGRDSRHGYGAPVSESAVRISTRNLRGVTRFARDDLTCGVRVGTTWNELLETVEAEGLTVESGTFARQETRTVGGIFAESPPSRRGHDRASLRSQVIGLTAIDGLGRTFHSGGQVVKNVAGYDVCKLFVGSGGAWFAATELQLRLVSLPRAATLCSTETMPRDAARELWLETRRDVSELRACDLVLERSGGARVEFLAAGAKELVACASRRDRFRVSREDRDAWNAPAMDISDRSIVCRGRVMPSEIRTGWLATLPEDCTGRIGYQGAFEIGAETSLRSTELGRGFVRALRGAPAAMSSTPKIDRRMSAVFGMAFAKSRSSFDTETTILG